MQRLIIFLLGFYHPCWSHDEQEYDYWTKMQAEYPLAYQYNRSIPWQIRYMIPPGGKCVLEQHLESYMQHHLIRHGLLDVTKKGFIAILNHMCAFMPYFNDGEFAQIYQCAQGRCICPFEFLTWSREENKCKIRIGYPCGEVPIARSGTVSLEKSFGCATGSTCVNHPEGESTNHTNSQQSPIHAVCKCKHRSRKHCPTVRLDPLHTDHHPPPVESAALQLSFTAFTFLCFHIRALPNL